MSPHTKPHYDVAVIGAGFCGAMVAVNLSQLAPRLRVLVADRGGAFARGVAYNTYSAQHLLNVPAAKMGAFPDKPDHFVDWLASHREELTRLGIFEFSAGAFLPRAIYGTYLRDLFREAQRVAPGIEVVEEEIIDVEVETEHLVLITQSGNRFTAGKVVLALGNFSPGDPPTKDRKFHRSQRYLNAPLVGTDASQN